MYHTPPVLPLFPPSASCAIGQTSFLPSASSYVYTCARACARARTAYSGPLIGQPRAHHFRIFSRSAGINIYSAIGELSGCFGDEGRGQTGKAVVSTCARVRSLVARYQPRSCTRTCARIRSGASGQCTCARSRDAPPPLPPSRSILNAKGRNIPSCATKGE